MDQTKNPGLTILTLGESSDLELGSVSNTVHSAKLGTFSGASWDLANQKTEFDQN